MENFEIIELSKVDPKKAINKLAIPTMISTFILYLNTFVDGIWVSGLSADALAALGFVYPLYYIIVGMAMGYSSGVNSVMSRFISLEKYADANNTILHTLVLTVFTYFIFFLVGYLFIDQIIILVGGGSVLELCREYIQPVYLLSIFLMAVDVNAGLYRARSDVKRASRPFIVMAIANIILDPIFIYILNFGISGAAYATILSAICALVYMNVGQDFRKDIIFKTKDKNYRFELKFFKEILAVSLPVSLNEAIFSVFSIAVNYLILFTAGAGEIASYVIAKRFSEFVYAPGVAMGSAVITVGGAAYASKLWDKFDECINYAAILATSIAAIIALLLFLFPYQFCGIFSIEMTDLSVINRAAEILTIYAFYNVLTPLGLVASRTFEGVGNGLKSLLLSLSREIAAPLLFAYLLGITLGMGVFGVYVGMVVGLSLGSIISFIIVKRYSMKLKKEWGY